VQRRDGEHERRSAWGLLVSPRRASPGHRLTTPRRADVSGPLPVLTTRRPVTSYPATGVPFLRRGGVRVGHIRSNPRWAGGPFQVCRGTPPQGPGPAPPARRCASHRCRPRAHGLRVVAVTTRGVGRAILD
jgi:hypothetical protein